MSQYKCCDSSCQAIVLTYWASFVASTYGSVCVKPCEVEGLVGIPRSVAGHLALDHFADTLVAAAVVAAAVHAAAQSGQCCLHCSLHTCPSW